MAMFSFLRKSKRQEKMFQKLDGLQKFAQLSMLLNLQDEFAQEMDKTEAMRWAAAIVNDLFGNPTSKISIASLDMDEVSLMCQYSSLTALNSFTHFSYRRPHL